MRTIQFRAWDKKAKEMRLVVDLNWIYLGPDGVDDYENLIFEGVQTRKGMEGVNRDHYTNEVEVMQYTGLLDKNGTEIYEGDILQVESMGDANGTAVVKFWERPPEFGLDYLHNEGRWIEDWNLTDDSESMTIIGNIYENKDLLDV